jgi:hypothetical protein
MAFLTGALAVLGGSAAAREAPDGAGADRGIALHPAGAEPSSAGWTLHVDNDLFALADRDRDYTAGVAFSLGGDSARTRVPALFRALDGFDAALALGPFAPQGHVEGHALELGLLLFTPQDLAAPQPLFDDRPYASLFYVSGTRLRHDDERGVAYQTSLTLGVLGLPLAGALHRAVHDAFGSVEPRGYGHQISAGGEPTFRYTASRYQRLAHGELAHRSYSVRLGTDASLGYVTEINSEVSVRWGRTHLAWWESPPGSSEYAGHPPVHGAHAGGGDGHGVDVLFDAGAKLRLRLYDAFLQGQFRKSDVEFSSGDVNHVLLESWLGVTTVLNDRLSISYTIRHQTKELDAGRGARSFTWASIGIAQQF